MKKAGALHPGLLSTPAPLCCALPFLSVALRRGARHVYRYNRLIAYHPSVVPRRDHVRFARTNLLLRAIFHPDVQPSRYLVAGVQHLAGIGPRYGLDVLRPPPARLEDEARGVEIT